MLKVSGYYYYYLVLSYNSLSSEPGLSLLFNKQHKAYNTRNPYRTQAGAFIFVCIAERKGLILVFPHI